jgi:hypothetical protein
MRFSCCYCGIFVTECGLLQDVKENFASSKQKFCCIFLTFIELPDL